MGERFESSVEPQRSLPAAYLSWSATLSMPALEQSSSLPGDPGHADGPDYVFADLDRQPARQREHAGIFLRAGRRRIVEHPFDEIGRRRAERARGISLPVAALGRMQTRAISAQHNDGQAGAVDHRHRDPEAQLLALVHRSVGNR